MKSKLTLLLITFSFALNAQITTTGQALSKPEIISTTDILQYELARYGDDRYILSYRNLEYKNISDHRQIPFKATNEELESLYNDLINTIGTSTDKTYTLNKHNLIVSPKKKSLFIFVTSETETDSYFYITQKNLERLFGKR